MNSSPCGIRWPPAGRQVESSPFHADAIKCRSPSSFAELHALSSGAPRGARAGPRWRRDRRFLGSTSAGEGPQQTQLAIQQRTCLLALDLPAPRIREIQRPTDLSRTAVRHVEEPSRIAAMTAIALGEVEHDAARRALDLSGSLGAVSSKLCDHGAQGADQIQGDVIGNQHVSSWWVSISGRGTPSADDLRGWAPPVATDPRKTRDERRHRRGWSSPAWVLAAHVGAMSK